MLSASTFISFLTTTIFSVIPAVDESGKTISVPKIPDREGSKLRAKLAEVASVRPYYCSAAQRTTD